MRGRKVLADVLRLGGGTQHPMNSKFNICSARIIVIHRKTVNVITTSGLCHSIFPFAYVLLLYKIPDSNSFSLPVSLCFSITIIQLNFKLFNESICFQRFILVSFVWSDYPILVLKNAKATSI